LSVDSIVARSAKSAGTAVVVRCKVPDAAVATKSGNGVDGLSFRRGSRAITDPARKLTASGRVLLDSDSN